jgi:Ulp1 family protease
LNKNLAIAQLREKNDKNPFRIRNNVRNSSISLYWDDIKTIFPTKWIISHVINYIGQYLCEKYPQDFGFIFTGVFKPFFDNNPKNENFIKEIISSATRGVFIPLHFPFHWALGYIDIISKCIYYFDSISSISRFNQFKSFVQSYSTLKDYSIINNQINMWQQNDSNSCGVAVISNMIYI